MQGLIMDKDEETRDELDVIVSVNISF